MSIVEQLRIELAKENTCPICLGELDTGWECNDCGYDAIGEIEKFTGVTVLITSTGESQ